jgi:hypothetical protein
MCPALVSQSRFISIPAVTNEEYALQAPKTSVDPEKGTVAGSGCLLEVFAQNHVLPQVGELPMKWIEDGHTVTLDGTFRMTDGGRGGFGGVASLVVPAKYI